VISNRLRDARYRIPAALAAAARTRRDPLLEVEDSLILLCGELRSCLILNDRVSLVRAAGFDGVHVGQEDLSPAEVRATLGSDLLIGVSTHSERQLLSAGANPADYVAIVPVFATLSKQVPDPVVGLDGVRAARAMIVKPLVAIGGINRGNCAAVIESGADSVAVISDLIPTPGKRVEEFLSIFC
jgi:thiamine-phosphate pyrophosphorylase